MPNYPDKENSQRSKKMLKKSEPPVQTTNRVNRFNQVNRSLIQTSHSCDVDQSSHSPRNGYNRFPLIICIRYRMYSLIIDIELVLISRIDQYRKAISSSPAISASCISSLRSRFSSWYQSHRRLNRSLSMAASSSEITKTGKGKAIVVQTPIAPNTVGFHVPIKLTKDNFLLWKTQIFPLLNFHDLAHILTQDPPISTQLDDQGGIIVSSEYQAWWRQDQQVLSLIVTSLSESVLSCVIGTNTAKEAWSAFSSHCSSTNPSRIMHLRNCLHNNSKGTRSVAEFVQEIQRTCDELAAAGHPVQEIVTIYALLRGLGPSYSSFCAGISSNLSHLSLEDVIAQINSYDELLKFSNPIKETATTDFAPMANQTQISSTDRGRGRNNGRNSHGRGRNGGRYVPRCQLCG